MAAALGSSARRPTLTVDLLLADFPAPPSFIPPSPSPGPGPTPSPSLLGPPPTLPLPPVPGPSPLSAHDLSLSALSSASARSRRASKASVASSSRDSTASSSWRDSSYSTASASASALHRRHNRNRDSTSSASVSTDHPSPSASTHTFGPSRARPDSGSVTSYSPSTGCTPAIDEHLDDDDDEHALTRLSLADVPRATPSPNPYPYPYPNPDLDPSHRATPSPLPPAPIGTASLLSMTSLADIPADDGGDDDDGAAPADMHAHAHAARALHREMRAARSRSGSHKNRILAATIGASRPVGSGTLSPNASPPVHSASPPVPGTGPRSAHGSRATSPEPVLQPALRRRGTGESQLSVRSAQSTGSAAARVRLSTASSSHSPSHSTPPPPSAFPSVLSSPNPASAGAAARGPAPARPRARPSDPGARVPSPDIASILATTPRPRRRSEASSRASRLSVASASSSSASARPLARVASLPASRRASRASSGISRASSRRSGLSASELPYVVGADYGGEYGYGDVDGAEWNEESFVEDYGVVLSGGHGMDAPPVGEYGDVEEDEENASEEADSDLDLHTPLPNLMVKHGMLSPSSKLLAQSQASRATTPAGGRPGSILSVETSMTKSGVYRDDRDTPQRRVRHRDGRLLRGGIGLTTGLGWSDSEDEGATSALTRRLSSLALAHRSSSASLAGMSGAGTPGKSSRAQSIASVSRSKSSASLARSQGGTSTDRKQSSSSMPRSKSPRPPPPRTRQSRNSEPVSPFLPDTPRAAEPDTPARARAASESLHGRARARGASGSSAEGGGLLTPSSGSTASLRTPDAFELADPPPGPRRRRDGDREKSLPPLPRLSRGPSLTRQPSSSGLRAPAPSWNSNPHSPASASAYAELALPSSLSTPAISPAASALSHSPRSPPMSPPGPRPLLTASIVAPPAGFGALQPGEPETKSLLGYNRNLHDAQRARASGLPRAPPSLGGGRSPVAPSSALGRSSSAGRASANGRAPANANGRGAPPSALPRVASQPSMSTGDARPRPRIGTGMAYRKSSAGALSVNVNVNLGKAGRSPGSNVSSALPSPTPSYTGAVAI